MRPFKTQAGECLPKTVGLREHVVGSLLRKVKTVLKEAFPLPDRIKIREEDGIVGMVVSRRFEGLESVDRLNMIWKVLDSKLSPAEARQIVVLLAVTPDDELVPSE